jgi:hypothetical protein
VVGRAKRMLTQHHLIVARDARARS